MNVSSLRILGIILAGGKGTRLYPLTKDRAKPAVPFGGQYRIIDFVLSNFVNSGILSMYVLTQFKAQSMLQHLRDGWQIGFHQNQFIIPVPAQMRQGEQWYKGTSDAIYQNIHLLDLSRPDVVAVFGADHIYLMDIRQMIVYHAENAADGTVAALPIPVEEAGGFGTMEVDEEWRIKAFYEKVPNPPEIPGRPGWTLASMGNYLFNTPVLKDELRRDAEKSDSTHDFGKNMLPEMVREFKIYAYDYLTNQIPGALPENQGYWRDVGTLDAYYEANMDLRDVRPQLNLFNPEWPIRTARYDVGPAKYTFDEDGRRGHALNSVVSSGCILAGGEVRNSVLGRSVIVDNGATVNDSILLDRSRIGKDARISRAIIGKNAQIPDGAIIDAEHCRDNEDYHVTESGIAVVDGGRSPIAVSPVFL